MTHPSHAAKDAMCDAVMTSDGAEGRPVMRCDDAAATSATTQPAAGIDHCARGEASRSRAGQGPEPQRGSEAQAGEVPVVRQEDVLGKSWIEQPRRRERRRLPEQRNRLGHDHQDDPGRDEAPQPFRHPTREESRERHPEAEREPEEPEPVAGRLEHDSAPCSGRDRGPRLLSDAEHEGPSRRMGVVADDEPLDEIRALLAGPRSPSTSSLPETDDGPRAASRPSGPMTESPSPTG